MTEAVAQVAKAVAQKTTLPSLTGIKLEAEDDKLILTASNSDITIQYSIFNEDDERPLVINKPGKVVLPGRIFSDIVRKLPGENVEWIIDEKFQAQINSGQAEFRLNGYDPLQYPHLPDVSTGDSFKISAEQLNSLIRQSVFAVATSETRGVLTGVLWQMEDSVLSSIATDSHRLSKQQTEVVTTSDITFSNVVIPGKSLVELARTFSDYHGYVEVHVAQNMLMVKSEQIYFFSRLLDGSYPDTNRVIPEKTNTRVIAPTRDLLFTVDRASLISRDGKDNVIKWTVGKNKVEVHSQAQEIGSVNEEVSASVDGDEFSISFNARYMMEALRASDSEEVVIQFTGALTPFTITPREQEDSLHLIVPIRTRG